MDPLHNPFAPGAGSSPPELAGRDEIIKGATTALQRIQLGRPEKSQMLLGLRGVGKTVLLNRISQIAQDLGYLAVTLEAPEGQRLVAYLAPALKGLIVKLSKFERAKDLTVRAAAALRGLASVFKISVGEFAFEIKEPATADSGNLEVDLPELLIATAEAAGAAEKSVALFIDEVQYLSDEDLRALIVSMHRVAQKNLPMVFFGAGLPQVAGLAGEAKSYAERLFDYPDIGPLPDEEAERAIREPIRAEDADIQQEALAKIVAVTKGYPYFLQEWGKHTWNTAPASPITPLDVDNASESATEALDKNFFRVRFDRLTPREQDYLRAMAELGPGPHRSGAIADELGVKVEKAGPLRSGLIGKGMIWSPAHGDTAFTVPMFDEFMRRAMPVWPIASETKGRRKK
jgi:hypothetical protein